MEIDASWFDVSSSTALSPLDYACQYRGTLVGTIPLQGRGVVSASRQSHHTGGTTVLEGSLGYVIVQLLMAALRREDPYRASRESGTRPCSTRRLNAGSDVYLAADMGPSGSAIWIIFETFKVKSEKCCLRRITRTTNAETHRKKTYHENKTK